MHEQGGVVFAVGGAVVGAAASMLAKVDITVDAAFIAALGAVGGAFGKWVHGLWRTRSIYRAQQVALSGDHWDKIELLAEKMDKGFDKIEARLMDQDTAIASIREDVGKAAATSESLFQMIGELEGKLNARPTVVD